MELPQIFVPRKERSILMKNRSEKITAGILLCLLIMCLLPVMYLGRYNHPTGDDYYYGAETKAVWEQTGSIFATIAEAAHGVSYQYVNWQGTYSAMFLMYLPPIIFGDWAYRLVTSIFLLLLTGSIFYLLKPIVSTVLKGSVSLWIILCSLLVLLCIQTVPSQGETFFWYNGSMYYTGYYAVTLLLFGVLFRYLLSAKHRYIPIMMLLAVFVAGGNYVSLLPALLLLVCLTVVLLLQRSKPAWAVCCTTLVMTLGLSVSAMAPGNSIRQSDMWKIPAWKAVLKSLLQGVNYTTAWTGKWLILCFLIMTPFLWRSFSKTSFRFRYPLVALGFIYGIFCSMSCPTFYTMNSTGPARAVAIVYYGFHLAAFLCYAYFLGWLHRVITEKYPGCVKMSSVPFIRYSFLVIALLILGIQLISGKAEETTTGKAIRLLINKEAQGYEQEYQERLAILENDDIKDVVFQPYVHQPDMLYVGDFSEDAQAGSAPKIAQYFGKNTVRVEY